MYRLLITASAEKDLRKLSDNLFQRINDHLLALQIEPRPTGVVKLSGSLVGWRIRVGDYRIVYQINDGDRSITIVRVKHRRGVYR
jgi:mRNA interferase RelE/StbE